MIVYKSLACAAAAFMLAGCDGVVVTGDTGPQIDYFDGDFDYATHKGAIVTEVYGNPFTMPAERFRDTVLNYMDKQNRGVPAAFTATANDRTLPPYKVVAVFNPLPSASAENLCEDGAGQLGANTDGTVRLAMAFCFGGQPKTGVSGRVANVGNAEDPRFAELVRQVTHSLIPAGDSEDQGEGGKRRKAMMPGM